MNNVARIPVSDSVVPLPHAPSGTGVDVLALTEDDFFLLTVRKVVTLPNRIWHVTSDTQAADMLLSTPCAVALVDTALVQSRLAPVLTRLREQFPDLTFVVAGEPADEAAMRALIEAGEVQSFIVKQHAGRRLAGGLEAGINRHLELKTESETRAIESANRRRAPMLIGAAVGGLAVIALVAWVIWTQTTQTSNTPANATKPSPTAPIGTGHAQAVEEALQQAREAFEAGRFLSNGKSAGAVDHYHEALTLEPTNPEAKEGVTRIAEIMLARTELALVQGDVRGAGETLKLAKTVEPTHPRIEFLGAQISREAARSASAREEAARVEELNRKLAELSKARATQTAASEAAAKPAAPAPARGTAEADRLLALGYERLNQGKLLQPADDSARDYLLKLKQLQPDHPSLTPALNSLRERLLNETTQALQKRNPTQANNLLEGARSVGAEGSRVEKLATEVSRVSLQTQLLTNPEVLQTSMIDRQFSPNYPARARRESVEGYVDLRFIATKEGEVRDIVVVGAQPEGYFEEEAVRAVKRWKIKPRRIDGELYEQLLSLRLRFVLE